MSRNKEILLNLSKENEFIEIFRLEEIEDNRFFGNYQRYDFYQLLWFTEVSGDTFYFLDFNDYTLADNQIILIYPGQIDKMNIIGKKGYLYAIHNEVIFRINQRLKSDYLNGYFSNVFLSPEESVRQTLNQINGLMIDEYDAGRRLVLMESYMEAFLFHLSSLVETTDMFENKSDSVVAELMRLIDANFINERETDFYADKLGVTNKIINDICKKGTGKTVKQHLQEKLILEIKKEIRIGRKSMKEIAFDLGFSEAAYFTRFFKLHTSMTPTEFRDN